MLLVWWVFRVIRVQYSVYEAARIIMFKSLCHCKESLHKGLSTVISSVHIVHFGFNIKISSAIREYGNTELACGYQRRALNECCYA